MPLNLEHFLNIAANRTTSEIYVSGPDHRTTAQTRGTLKSWLVSVFKGDRTRNQRTETTHAFLAALQEKVTAKTSGLGNARPEVLAQYHEDTNRIVAGLRNILAEQLNGRTALTARDIRIAADFVDSTLAQADAEKESLLAHMHREDALAQLESTVLQFFGRESLPDIKLTDAEVSAKAVATRNAQEQAMAARGIRVVSRAPDAPPPEPAPMLKLLRGYLAGNPEPMNFEQAEALLKDLRAQIRDIKHTCSVGIPKLTKLSNGESPEPNQWTKDIEPGSDEAKLYLNALTTMQDQYLGPMLTLEYFMRADMAEAKRERFLDSKTLNLNNGNTKTSDRSLREILDDFQAGKQLSEAEINFVTSAGNSRELNQINQMRPGFVTFSSGGNPGSLMTDVLDGAASVPNQIWSVITGQASPERTNDPDRASVLSSPPEANRWGLSIQQTLLERGDDMQAFSNAQKGLADLFDLIGKSNGNLAEAKRLESATAPHAKSGHHWKESSALINQKVLERENDTNELEHRFSPDKFARGVNRSLNITPESTPGRGHKVPGKEYTRGYDDDIDSGIREASNPSNPVNRPKTEKPKEGEAPKKGILKKPLEGYQKKLHEVKQLTKRYAFDSELIESHAIEKNMDLARLTQNHQDLYNTIFFHQTKATATDNPSKFNETAVIKSAKNILEYVNTLSDEQAQASLARFAELRQAGEAVLASITDTDIPGLENQRQALGQAVINYVDKVNSNGILRDMACLAPGEELRGDELGQIKVAVTDLAFSSVEDGVQERIFKDAIKEESPLRSAYIALGAHDSNPAIKNNNAFDAVMIEFMQGLNFIVQQVGQNANVSPVAVRDAVGNMMQTMQTGRYEDLTNSVEVAEVSPQTKVIFDTFAPYIAQREVIIRDTAEAFDNRSV